MDIVDGRIFESYKTWEINRRIEGALFGNNKNAFSSEERMFSFLSVVDQDYELQVYPSYAYLGNTAVVKCLMPPYVKEFLEVSTWMWGSELITSDIEQGLWVDSDPYPRKGIRNLNQNELSSTSTFWLIL